MGPSVTASCAKITEGGFESDRLDKFIEISRAFSMIRDHTPDGTWYEMSGDEKNPKIVFCHGVGLDLNMWDSQVLALTDQFHVVRYDLLGHGKTTSREPVKHLDQFTGQLVALINYLNFKRIALVGLSLGGIIAQRFAADYPERIIQLALINTIYQCYSHESEGFKSRLAMTERYGLKFVADAAIKRWFDDAFVEAQPELVGKIRRRLLSNDINGYLAAYRILVNARAEVGDALKSVRCPTLIVTGGRDRGSTPRMALRMVDDLTDARVVIFETLNHLSPVENPRRISAELHSFFHN